MQAWDVGWDGVGGVPGADPGILGPADISLKMGGGGGGGGGSNHASTRGNCINFFSKRPPPLDLPLHMFSPGK